MKKAGMLIILFASIIFVAGCAGEIKEGLVDFPTEKIEPIPLENIGTTSSTLVTTTTAAVATTTMSEATVTSPSTTTIEEVKTNLTDKDNGIVIFEGDLVKLNLKATDPDGNALSYTFSSPLNNQGEWQTETGDEGTYNVVVTASDGSLSTTKNVKITVRSRNKLPVIENLDKIQSITVNEGDIVNIQPIVSDPDGDDTTIKFDGFMKEPTYKTTFDDAGTHQVTLTVSDGKGKVTKLITVKINNVNRPPALVPLKDISVIEGERVELKAQATDLDGDKVNIEYSKPLVNGAWQTSVGDAGTYDITVSASDGELTAQDKVRITVLSANRPPVFGTMDNIDVKEGQTIVITPSVSDPDGDDITFSYSGFMTSNVYQTTYDDAGTHTVTITADDGVNTVKKDLLISIADQNRPPEDLQIDVTIVPGKG